MIKNTKYILLLISLLSTVFGQSYLVHKYTINSGLPSSIVNGIAQAPDGRIWLATRNAIASYDGFDWESYTLADGLPSNAFYRITTDNQGQLWACDRLLEFGIHYLEREKWHKIVWPDSSRVNRVNINEFAVFRGPDKTEVVIGTTFNGIYIYDGQNWRNYSDHNSMLGNEIYTISEKNGRFFILSDKGIFIYENGKLSREWADQFNFPASTIYSLKIDTKKTSAQNEKIWLVAKEWIGLIENNQLKTFPVQLRLSDNNYPGLLRLCTYGTNGLLIGNPRIVIYFNWDTKKITYINRSTGLVTAGATDFLVDRENNIWITSRRGVSKIPSLRFKTYRQDQGLFNDEVTAIAKKKDGSLVFGHEGGLSFYKNNKLSTLAFGEEGNSIGSAQRVLDLTIDSTDNVWAAVQGRGVVRITSSGKRIDYIENFNGWPNSIVCDKNGRIWMASDYDLFRFEQDRFKQVDKPEGLRFLIRKLFINENGKFHLATRKNGLVEYSQGKWSVLYSETNRQANNVFSVLDNYLGRILVGSMSGLLQISGGKLSRFDDGFSIDDPVYLILAKDNDGLWIGTDSGVYHWNGTKNTHFTTDHGLAGLEVNRSAGLAEQNGRLWFGTDRGVSCYDPSLDIQFNVPPLLNISSVEVAGKKQDPDKNLKLSNNENNIIFNISCISFKDEKKIKYRYKLNGFDKSWINEENLVYPQIRYLNLPAGDYQLFIQAANVDAHWSEIKSTATIHIQLPFWKAWWFFLSLISIFAMLIYFMISHYSKKKYTLRLRRIIEKRTKELKISEEKYRKIFEESRDGIFISTPEGRFLEVNPAGVELFGYDSREELLSIDILKDIYYNSRDRKKFTDIVEKQGYANDIELRIKKKNGEPLIIILASTAVYEDGKIIAYRGFIKDVTERWHLKEQLAQAQKMESVGMLAGGIAHDFNNILGGILGYASLLKLKLKNDNPTFKSIDTIEKSAMRGAELTNQLLAFARRSESMVTLVNLNTVTQDTIKIISSTFPKKIEIITNFEVNLPMVQGDKTQLQQIVMNLCVNARDAVEGEGKIDLITRIIVLDDKSVKLHMDAKEGKYVLLEIVDTGKGMNQDTIKRIFEPFYSTKEQGKGTGLGLSMVYGYVKGHGGFVDVESTPGKGTIFRIFLPAADGSAEKTNIIKDENNNGSELILVADDEEILRDFCKRALESHGYKVLLAENGQDAVTKFQKYKEDISLVLLDMIMPKMDGLEALKSIKNIMPGTRILISSGYTDDEKAVEIDKNDVAGFLQKPYRVNEFLRQVRTALDNKTTNSS